MSVAALIRSMSAAGAPAEAIALAVEAVEAVEGQLAAQRSAARDRKRAQRAKSKDSHGTVTGQSEDSHVDPRPLPLSPQTPQTPTPTPGVCTTREARDREDAAFGRFWSAYPRKVSKADARKAFTRAWRKLPPFDEEAILIGSLERAKASWTEAQFIPHPATWLNGERWQDEPSEVIHISPRKAHERHSPDAKFTARQANLATFERGADIAARLHRES